MDWFYKYDSVTAFMFSYIVLPQSIINIIFRGVFPACLSYLFFKIVCSRLGIDDFYFFTTPADYIAQHIQSIYAGKILAVCSSDPEKTDFHFKMETKQLGMAHGVFDLL